MYESEQPKNVNPRDGSTAPGEVLHLPAELRSFEAALAQLRPGALSLDRDRLMFLAGQASVRGAAPTQRAMTPRWFWPTSSAVMTGVAAVLLVMLVRQNGPTITDGTRAIVTESSTPSDTERAAMPLSPNEPSLGAWTIARLRTTDELLSLDSLARTGADFPAGSASADIEEPLSSRSFQQLLDEINQPRRAADRSLSPKSSG